MFLEQYIIKCVSWVYDLLVLFVGFHIKPHSIYVTILITILIPDLSWLPDVMCDMVDT